MIYVSVSVQSFICYTFKVMAPVNETSICLVMNHWASMLGRWNCYSSDFLWCWACVYVWNWARMKYAHCVSSLLRHTLRHGDLMEQACAPPNTGALSVWSWDEHCSLLHSLLSRWEYTPSFWSVHVLFQQPAVDWQCTLCAACCFVLCECHYVAISKTAWWDIVLYLQSCVE